MPEFGEACEVLVVGGGPAAATAATLLSSWGRRVVLVAKPAGDEPELPESLTPSCGKFFDLMGIRPAIDDLGFVRSTGHTAWWGPAAGRVEPFPAGALGWQATSTRLSERMLQCAVSAGATLVRRALTADEAVAWPSAFRLDCTGRSGVLARSTGQRRYEAGHRTVALIGLWTALRPWPLDDQTHTLIESYADGWAWSVPIDLSRRTIAVMVDPKATSLAKGEGARATYLAEVAKTRHLAQMADAGVFTAGPWGWDASMYSARRPAGDDWFLVGDAASFVDPLSSAGVKKAMASAWLAAVSVNTTLTDPSMAEPAVNLFVDRERAVYTQFLALTKLFMAEAGGTAPDAHPFWSERATDEAAEAVPRSVVEAAFGRLKAADPLVLRRAPNVRIEVRPALGERLITMERHVVADDLPDGVRFVLDVDVAALVEVANRATDVPGLYAIYTDQIGRVSWPSFLTALATAIGRKWLILG